MSVVQPVAETFLEGTETGKAEIATAAVGLGIALSPVEILKLGTPVGSR